MRLPFSLPKFLVVALLSATVVLQYGVEARAEYPIKIKNVRVGFAPGPYAQNRDENNQPYYLFKAATWAPVWVELEGLGAVDDPKIEITVETSDGDDVIAAGSIVVPAPQQGRVTTAQEMGRGLYVKPGGATTDVTVNVRGAQSRKLLAEPWRRSQPGLYPSRYLLLSVGASLAGVRLSRGEGQGSEEVAEKEPLRNGWVELAQITNVSELPDHWFGYQAVDLMILTTATDPQFWADLAGDVKRRKALSEWVRRGGRLIVSVGANANGIRAIPELRDMLPARLPPGGKQAVDQIAMVLPNLPRMLLVPATGGKLALHTIEPIADRPYLLKLAADERDNPPPLVVQASFGLGRVTLVSFDLDEPVLAVWKHREAFWDWLITSSGGRLPSGAERASSEARTNEHEDEYVNRLHNNLDFFEGVPVVSFGWVALIMLVYILVIGPIEYLILKKLLKRLEWTWLTFPIIVAGTCALTYVTAVAVKGREMKINKIDVVDVDLRSEQAIGRTWFAVFSPGNRDYTIGVEPVGPRLDDPAKNVWFSRNADETIDDTVVTWQGRAKSNRQSLFRRTYSYHVPESPDSAVSAPFAVGLDRVPIQIWSTKAFTASWSVRLDPTKPLFVSTLHVAKTDPSQITGSITSHLPIEILVDAQLIYRDHIVALPALTAGTPRFISTNPQSVSTATWLQGVITQKDLLPSNRTGRPRENDDDPNFRLWPALFHDTTTGHLGRLWNASLRDLDQSWRINEKNPHEAVLIARIGRSEGPAEEMSNSPNAPTRLWLNAIPGKGQRERLTGTLRQETYIRVYIPIAPNR